MEPITVLFIAIAVGWIAYLLGWHRGYTEAANAHRKSLDEIQGLLTGARRQAEEITRTIKEINK